MAEPLTVSIADGVARVTFTRPDVHNAFDETFIAALTETFTTLDTHPEVRAIVLTAEGKLFSAGANLEWMGRMAGFSREENLADVRTAQQMFAAIAHCSKVTIARVQGASLGGGAGLVAVCDISIAADTATFAFSEVRLGIVPAVISPYVLQKLSVGAARALFVTGRRFDAGEALRLGLVQEVVPADELDAAVARTLADVRAAGPEAVATVKQMLRAILGMTPDEAAETTVNTLADRRVSGEGQEGIRAFLEKRKPAWHSE
jgi:methylglutaconyl-CoA hydratase